MNERTNTPQKARTLHGDPQYFGAFLNLARHNIFAVNNDVAKKNNFTLLDEEGKIANAFFTNPSNKLNQHQRLIYAQLRRFLPILKVFDYDALPIQERENNPSFSINFNSLADTLKIVFKELNEFRNDYSHYYSVENGIKRKLSISNALKDFLTTNYQRAIAYAQQRLEEVLLPEDFVIAAQTTLVDTNNNITQDGIIFLSCMFLTREHAIQLMSNAKGLKGTHEKPFIAKREVMMSYCITLPHDKFVSEDIGQALSLDIINELNKCPKTLYNLMNDANKKAFQPNIKNIENVLLNSVGNDVEEYEAYIQEISKKVRSNNRFYYFALRYIEQKRLLGDINFQIDVGKLILNEYPKSYSTGEPQERKIVENAKAFMPLHEITEEDALAKINRTGLSLVFEQYAPHYNIDNNKVGISFKKDYPIARPKTDNKANTPILKQPQANAFLSIHELQKIVLLEYLEPGATEKLIKNFVNTNDKKIFNRAFVDDIKSKINHLEVFQKRTDGKNSPAYNPKNLAELKSRKEALNKLLAPHQLNSKQIPTRILNYWLNIQEIEDLRQVEERIKLMRNECKNRLKAIDKGNYPKIGEMATFIARDIVQMIISEDKKHKITSFYYDKIQECLALFEDKEKKDLLIQILDVDLKLYANDGHPFLQKINLSNTKYTKDIYRNYLEEKGKKMVKRWNHKKGKNIEADISWMFTTFYVMEYNKEKNKNMTKVKLPDNLSNIPFTIRQFAKSPSDFDTWFNNVSKGKQYYKNGKGYQDNKKPVDLPTNLFDTTIKDLILKQLKEKGIDDVSPIQNYNELFKIWWQKIREDGTQPYYEAERNYTFTVGQESETLTFKLGTKPSFKAYCNSSFTNRLLKLKNVEREERNKTRSRNNLQPLTDSDVIKSVAKRIASTEKEIRILQEQDRLSLLMFERLVGNQSDAKLHFIEQVHNESIKAQHTVTGRLSFDNQGNLVKENKQKISKTITENRKRKEASLLKKYSYDRRLPELFEYFDTAHVEASVIKEELHTYNTVKDDIFDQVFELEQAIVDKDLEGVLSKNKYNISHIQHQPYLEWLLENNYINTADRQFLNMVRNTFSHNQYPQKQTMELYIKDWQEKRWANQIYDVYKNKITTIIQQIS